MAFASEDQKEGMRFLPTSGSPRVEVPVSETAVRWALDGAGVFRITLNRPERLNANQAQHESRWRP